MGSVKVERETTIPAIQYCLKKGEETTLLVKDDNDRQMEVEIRNFKNRLVCKNLAEAKKKMVDEFRGVSVAVHWTKPNGMVRSIFVDVTNNGLIIDSYPSNKPGLSYWEKFENEYYATLEEAHHA
ncbi:MAG: hypothetical protein IE914_05245 [Thiotrichales bacterium]|nr:hypothetical protein [Thiotrichales bacterium]